MATAAAELGERARTCLRRGVTTARELMVELEVSQPTLSRALRTLGADLLAIGAARSIQYALRDARRQELQATVYRVSAAGRLEPLGSLVPVHPEGFVLARTDGARLHSDGLPWWLFDMRPQGYLGRAYNLQYGAGLGLPARLDDWSDSHVLRALLLQGEDLPGNLLLGDAARDRFVNAPSPRAIARDGRAQSYAALAAAAARGEHHGSSAGGEQPKFTAYAQGEAGARHVIVKFTAFNDSSVSQRWRDLLMAEHLALEVLHAHGVAAARSSVLDHGAQRFLEVSRFDREGALGRRALFSLHALDAEFAGNAGNWPQVVRALAREGVVERQAVAQMELLWAFGTLIANTDMHGGNLSFIAEHGLPCQVAPAYDMTCMAFAPTSGGDLPLRELPLTIGNEVSAAAWRQALPMAQDFIDRMRRCAALSAGFAACLEILSARVATAGERIARLADGIGA
ncbi:type II toxin-antitoxin system HipA family toxin YjjJ [Herbaspirillum sp. WKF16]|uniref:type II toxin-antitoxin system HipA family toxin YjjJ n=1 Tax=Herbaspirillum sp. WKF16 TaxID=3028312 RepID=UPI0023A95322|nr:type II toxin-antitoxin system HipA family toxin YjjJ [Herbaspirillum sp. WKF16]WDZ98348.1 type II toxin-antitoxin system HipA family toxin YjjJ [Herbaspirillum sp. WKF16]